MVGLIELREKLRGFYGKHDIIVTSILKFLLTFICLMVINANIGYRTVLTNIVICIIISLVCSVIPYGLITCILGAIILIHIFGVSFEMALITAVFLLTVAVLFYGFHPRNSYILILTPLLFVFRIPYAIPLIMGLAGSMTAVIPVSCGVILYYMLLYVKQNAGALTNDASVDITQKYVGMVNAIINNKMMLITIAAFVVTIIVVYIIHNLTIDYSWVIAIAAGSVVMLIIMFVGDFVYSADIPVAGLILGTIASVAIAFIYYFFEMAVDYTRTEYTQFEDDDYYYYVKAVPKISVAATDIKVQKISTARHGGKRPTSTKEQ